MNSPIEPIDLSSVDSADLRARLFDDTPSSRGMKEDALDELLGRAAKKALRFIADTPATDPEECRLMKAVRDAGVDGGILTSDAIEELNTYLARRAALAVTPETAEEHLNRVRLKTTPENEAYLSKIVRGFGGGEEA